MNTNPDFISDNCISLCPLECNITQFETSVTSTKFLGDFYADYIKNNKNLSVDFDSKIIDATNSIVSINIFYDSLSYTLSTESPQMDLVSLLANIGGNLGLFLGESLLSFCELIEVAFEILQLLTKFWF